jgi:hypothetical protein
VRLPLNTRWTIPQGSCTYCNGSGRQWNGAGSREDCWECRGTGSREVQVICEVYRRGYAAGVREAVSTARRTPIDSFPTEIRVLLDSTKKGDAA